MKILNCLSVLAISLITLSCAVPPPAEDDGPVVGVGPLVSITPRPVAEDAICGFGSLPDDTQAVALSADRITPADQNGFADTTVMSVGKLRGRIASATIQQAGTCDTVVRFPYTDSTDELEWDGRQSNNEFVAPGTYLISVADQHGVMLAAGRVIVGTRDDVCVVQATEARQLLETRVSFSDLHFKKDIVLETGGPGYLCIEAERLDGSRVKPIVGIDETPLFTPEAFTSWTDSFSTSTPVYGDQVRLQLGGEDGAYRIRASFIADASLGFDVGELDTELLVTPDKLVCEGRLVSFAYPFDIERPGWPMLDSTRYDNGRRPVPRGGITVKCIAKFQPPPNSDTAVPYSYRRSFSFGALPDLPALYPQKEYLNSNPEDTEVYALRKPLPNIPGFGDYPLNPGIVSPDIPYPPIPPQRPVVFVAEGVTDASGAYRIEVPVNTKAKGGFIRLMAQCPYGDSYPNCGTNSAAAWTADLSYNGTLDVKNVIDAQYANRQMRLITKAGSSGIGPGQIRQPTIAESVILDDVSMGRLSDELESGSAETIFLPAEMNDLPFVVHEPFDPLQEDSFDYLIWLLNGQPRSFEDEPSGKFCELPREKFCYGYADCEWSESCGADSWPVQCPSVNILKALLDAGYDIWLVDHGRNSSVAGVAPDAPHLYQAAMRYPYTDDDREIAIAGLSAGGIITRVALSMWERKDELPALIDEHNLTRVRLSQPELLVEDPHRVNAFISFDAPHRGAVFPVAMQAYLNDDEYPPDADQTLPDLVNSKAAQELLLNYVDNSTDTKCFEKEGLFKLFNKKEVPKDCLVHPPNVDLANIPGFSFDDLMNLTVVSENKIGRTELDALMHETIEILGTRNDNSGFQKIMPDGIPNFPSSFAVANSPRYGAGIQHNTPEFLKLDIELGNSTRNQSLNDAALQMKGSTTPSICRAYSLAGPLGDPVGFGAGFVENCYDVLGYLGWGSCDLGGLIGAIAGALSGDDHGPVDVDVDVPMEFPAYVSAESAMNVLEYTGNVGAYAGGWEDVLWSQNEKYPIGDARRSLHFNVNDDACKFIRYHLDGTMKGDKDGVPACRSTMLRSCMGGGMAPGRKVASDDDYESNPGDYCDCDESTRVGVASRACSVRVLPNSLNRVRPD